ncbi:nucleolar protein 11-like [Erpetoichthys calabaricus]|uniref:Nucleolar protein 11 n=1 Tax=Erpetoichthys calabaricus TaxID=27687 RepID=A0A8C4T0F0_ERPCA|nr:nucleolar protein 11-like [Erpetoichthys calabaricus]
MAALFEGLIVCTLSGGKSRGQLGVLGVEAGSEADRIVVTDLGRSVTVYQVSDQKPLGAWTVKQGQKLTSPAVFNSQTGEFAVVQDNKVLRVWRDEDVNFDKVFKATLSANVHRLHAVPSGEPLALFERGAVRQLDTLLAVPQQEVESVLSENEVIRWSICLSEANHHAVLFATEKDDEYFLYLQKLNPDILQKYKMGTVDSDATPISFTATLQNEAVTVMCLYSSNCVYTFTLPWHSAISEEMRTLSATLSLQLPGLGCVLTEGAIASLDDAHIAVLGAPCSTEISDKDFLGIWNTHFQTLQASKKLAGGIHGQLWCYEGKLYAPHGKVLTAVPYHCEKSSLAAALGRLKHTTSEEVRSTALDWYSFLEGEATVKVIQTRRSKLTKKSTSQGTATSSINSVFEEVKNASQENLVKILESYLSSVQDPDLQVSVCQIVSELVVRCQTDTKFFPQNALLQLVRTERLSYSTSPDLLMLALEKQDFVLLQMCLRLFPDIPEAATCACLKSFLSIPDTTLEDASVDLERISFIESLSTSSGTKDKTQNGYSPSLLEEDSCDIQITTPKQDRTNDWMDINLPCPVSLKKAALLNDVLQITYTENFLLPNLKDLSVQQVLLLLQYLWFLYIRCVHGTCNLPPGFNGPSVNQILDWVSLLLDAHFTVLVLTPQAKHLLLQLHKFVRCQVKFFSELSKIEGSLQQLHRIKKSSENSLYSIEVLHLF